MRRVPGGLAAIGEEAFTPLSAAPWTAGPQKAWGTICRRIFAALGDTEVVSPGPGAACCAGSLTSWATCGYPRPVARGGGRHGGCWPSSAGPAGGHPALTAVGAAAIFAGTGDRAL